MTYEEMRKSLKGSKIVEVLPGQDERQNDFILVLEGSDYVDVHAVGDDMTYIEIEIDRQTNLPKYATDKWEKLMATDLLKDLFDRLSGCPQPDCSVCRSTKKNIEDLCKLLGLDSDEVMPYFLRRKEESNEKR